jgi:hypothetical protein
MYCRDLRVDEVAAPKRSGDPSKTINRPIKFDRQTITLAELAVEVGQWTRLPLIGCTRATNPLQKRYCAHVHSIVAARNSSAWQVGQTQAASEIGQGSPPASTNRFVVHYVSKSVTNVKHDVLAIVTVPNRLLERMETKP